MERLRTIFFKLAKWAILAVLPLVLLCVGAFLTMLFTIRGNEVIESRFDMEGAVGDAERPGGVTLELGYHAIADQLRALELVAESGRAFYAPRMSAVLGPPVERGPLPEALVRATAQPGAAREGEPAPPPPA